MTADGSQRERPLAIRRPGRAALVFLLASSVVLLSPGLPAYQACAVVVEDGPEGLPAGTAVPTPVVPSIPALGSAVPGLDAAAVPSAFEAAGPQVAAPSAQPAAASAQAQVPDLPAAAAPSGVETAQAAVPPAAPAQTSPFAALRSVGDKLAGTDQTQTGGIVAGLYGEKAGPLGGLSVSGSEQPGPGFSGLSTLSVSDLEGIASDPKKASDDRLSALKALARRGGAEAMAALERVGAYDAQATAADYEVKRQALRALAGLGKVVSLPAVSPAHAEAILSQLRSRRVEFAAFDFDKTLEDGNGAKISRETAEALTGLARSGVETMINTDRAADSRGTGDVGIFDSLSTLEAGERPWITVAPNRGARIFTLDADGTRLLVAERPAWTTGERAALAAAAQRVGMKYGLSRDGRGQTITDYDAALFLAPGLSVSAIDGAAALLKATLQELGLPSGVVIHQPRAPGEGSYLTVSKYDKSLGIAQLRRLRATLGRLRKVARLPGALRALGRKLVERIPSRTAPSNGLLVGDHFFGAKTIDADMMKAAPEGLGIAVGGTADPRLDGVFVWPTRGHQASMELARAAAAGASAGQRAPAADDPVNNKTLAALILQRLPSMAAYMLVTIAFVSVAVPIVGWTGYGILMSVGPMAGIAAANIMASVVKNMDARSAMALNTLLRVGSLMALPTFHFFGILNVGTLLLGALAEGFLLSSIMTTEGSFLKVLFPAKQLGNINGALYMMFPGVQVILGLFLSFGRLADKLSPFTIFAGAAAVNLLMVLPLILWGIPKIKLSQQTAAGQPAQPKPSLSALLKRYWKEVALLTAGIAVFVGLSLGMPALAALGAHLGWAWPGAVAAFINHHQSLTAPLPILGALTYWILRSDAFAALRSGKTAQTPEGARDGRQLRSIWLMAASTLLYYPLYLVAAPHVAEILVGAQNKGALTGQFLGALFFGSLISTSARTKLPEIGFTVLGRRRTVGVHQIVRVAVAGLVGLWMAGLAGAGLAAAAAGVAGAAAAYGLIRLSSRITDRGWIKLIGVGAAALWLPFVVWTWPALLPFLTIKTAMYLSLLTVGLFNGPNFVSLISYMQRNTLPSESSRVQGIQGALYNAAISAGYALLTIASGFLNPAYPAVLALLGVIAVILGAVFWRAPKGLPGLSERVLETRPKTPSAPNGGKS